MVSILDVVVLLIVAALCGLVGQIVAGYSVGGCITSTLVGFVGAVISTWLAGSLGLPQLFSINVAGRAFPIIWSILGSGLFVILLAILTRGRVTI
jgi:uncharacterized membrane protein YeaQ/YmgE (transglycosylase-associated protein family)